MASQSYASPDQPGQTSRWMQLLCGLICMMAISSPQYVWTLFTGPFTKHLAATLAQVQVTISILIVLQTFLSPFQGYLVDLFGPRTLLSVGAVLAGTSWVLAAMVNSTIGLCLTYGLLGGIGTGIIYVGVVGLMVRWFPDKKGFACGIVVARLRNGRDPHDFARIGKPGCGRLSINPDYFRADLWNDRAPGGSGNETSTDDDSINRRGSPR